MQALTIDQLTANLMSAAQLSRDDLESQTRDELRTLIRSLGVTHVTRGTGTIPYSRARKPELIEAILTATLGQRENLETEEGFINETWDVEGLVKETLKTLKTEVAKLWDMEAETYRSPGRSFMAMCSELAAVIKGDYAASTALNRRAEFFKAMDKAIATEKLGPDTTEIRQTYYPDYLKPTVYGLFTAEATAKKRSQDEGLKRRESSLVAVDVGRLLRWAYDVLSRLTSDTPATAWKDVSAALAIVTGRRQAELHSTAEFTLKDRFTVTFKGQLKAKGSASSFYESNPSYDIPTLVPAGLVVAAHEWLKTKGKIQPTPQAVNKVYSSDLGKALKDIIARVLGADFTGAMRESGRTFKYHHLRALYALAAASRKPMSLTDREYLRAILGHDRGLTEAVGGATTANLYLADFYLTEATLTRVEG